MSQLKEFHVSVMSGNTVKFGRGLIDADWTRITLLGVILLGSVVADGVLGTVVAIAGRRRAPVVLLLAAAILAVPLAHLSPAVTAFTAAIGVLPAALQKAGGVSVNVTYVTGTVVRFSRGLGELICRRAGNLRAEMLALQGCWRASPSTEDRHQA